MKRYINNDERLGDTSFEFTMPEMIACYRGNHWDEVRDERGFCERTMTDDEIVEDVLSHEIEELPETRDIAAGDPDIVIAGPENMADPFRGETPNEVSGWRSP